MFRDTERPATSSILLIAGLVLLGFVLANVLIVVLLWASGADTSNPESLFAGVMDRKNGWWLLTLAQGISAVVGFILPAWFYWRFVEKKSLRLLSSRPVPALSTFLSVFSIQLLAAPLIGFLSKVNERMQLPSSLNTLELKMKQMEDSLTDVTEMLTTFNDAGQFVFGFFVIAILAGVSEELIFRGLLQRKIWLGTQNPHLAIWLAAIVFSAIHFQFYGFLPRLFLGVLFGYIFYWTGNLWVPILAHIFNNGLAVVLKYLLNKGVISQDIEKLDHVPTPLIMVSTVLMAGLMWRFRESK